MDSTAVNSYLDKDFLYDELLCGFVSFSLDGKILSVNKTMAAWVGIASSDVQQLNFKSLMTKSSLLYYQMVIEPQLNLTGMVTEISLKFVAADGSFDALLSAQSYKNKDNNIFLINATIQKIAERKRYENELLKEKRHAEAERLKFEFLFNSAPTQIWTTNANGQILTLNKKVKDYFGIEQSPDAYGLAGVFSADRKKCYIEWKRRLSSGKNFEREIRLVGTKGIPEWFIISAEPFYNSEGAIEMWFWSATNINKQKLLHIANNSELKLSLSTAYQSLDKNAERFISIAMNHSHMIRKPLANILGLINLIDIKELSEEYQGIIKLLLESALELDKMIKNGIDGTSNKQ